MSWNIQRPDGVPEMAPLEGQPSMSHSQLLSNRDGRTDSISVGLKLICFLRPFPPSVNEIADFGYFLEVFILY